MKRHPPLFFLSLGLILLSFVSCGVDSHHISTSSLPKKDEELKREQNRTGTYRALLYPLNENLAGNTSGVMEIVITDDDLSVAGHVRGAPADVRHLQNIMLGIKCPDQGDDLNRDGQIDIKEAISVSGKILIPLDSDLSGQIDGGNFGPIANTSGNYSYKRSTALSPLLNDLDSFDPDPTDFITKLPVGADLKIEGKVVMVHGVSEQVKLPESISSGEDSSPGSMLPIACGVLLRVESEAISAPENNP